jgi:ferredoxin
VQGTTQDFDSGKRLVKAIEAMGIHIGHRCGGFARCTTCRVVFRAGEPDTMTEAEFNKLKERELLGTYRLSCQICLNHDMEVEPQMTLENQDWTDTGPTPDDTVQPEAAWLPKSELEKHANEAGEGI